MICPFETTSGLLLCDDILTSSFLFTSVHNILQAASQRDIKAI